MEIYPRSAVMSCGHHESKANGCRDCFEAKLAEKDKEIDRFKGIIEMIQDGLKEHLANPAELMRFCNVVTLIDWTRELTEKEIEYGKSLEPYAKSLLQKLGKGK